MAADLAAALHRAFLAAYPSYVATRLETLGAASAEGVAAAVEAGGRWLDDELGALLARPYREQPRSPLELFQEALRHPTEALAALGIPEVARDPAQAAALPGDGYGLAPASSQELGEAAWRAHLAWGADKARAFSPRPTVVYCGGNLMDRTAIEGPVASAGLDLIAASDHASLRAALGDRPVVLVLVDLATEWADDAVRAASGAGARTVGFGPHVDDDALVRARSLGAEEALPRSLFFRRLPDLMPTRA